MLWSGYLIGCGRYSKQERALSGSRGSSRSFSVQAGAVRIAAEPENVRQPHVLLEIHGGGEGGELDACAGIMVLTAKWEQISPRPRAPLPPAQPFPAALPSLPPAAPVHGTVRGAGCPSWAERPSVPLCSCLRCGFAGRRLGMEGCSLPCRSPSHLQPFPSPRSQGPARVPGHKSSPL